MTRRGMEEVVVVPDESVSPPAVTQMASPAASPPSAPAPAPSPPLMLATMTPVSVIELQKDLCDAEQAKAAQMYVGDEGGVSVVVQQQPHLFGAPGGGAATTVLVLSELVDDMGSVIGFRKRKDAGEEERAGPRMADVPAQPAEDSGWRPYYEHPFSAVTTAMLNIAGTPEEAQPAGFVYEYYKVQDKDKLADIWPTTSSASGGGSLLTSQLKAANGLSAGAGLELIAPPPGSLGGSASSAIVAAADLQGLFLQHQQQTHVKREPEDLSHHRKSPSDKQQQQRRLVVVSANGDVDAVKEELGARSRTPSSTSSLLADAGGGPIELIATADGLKPMAYSAAPGHMFHSGSASPIAYSDPYTTATSSAPPNGYVTTLAGSVRPGGGATFAVTEPYYREYFEQQGYGSASASQQRQAPQGVSAYSESPEPGATSTATSFVERYVRSGAYHGAKGVVAAGLTVDLPSPDSGIGTDAITPRDQTAIQQQFDYTDLCQAPLLADPALAAQRAAGSSPAQAGARSRPWHDFGRQSDADKIQIPKLYSQYGFKYHLETPISTSQRREDDRITYINKGQFYGITLEYIPDPDKPLKNQTVKSVVMLMFREEKSPEDEIKAWQFWHGRQHSVKQRILDADTKNSVGLVGCIGEVAHNAIAVYWNPLESSAKINVAVQCLSTDFSSQKGVKGLPLHLQIDTYEDPSDGPVIHRGYCQIKVFCDKGAERKTRDEERRAAKRKMTATGRKKLDELYHPAADRSEFYSMSDLAKPPVLFTPAEDIDKLASMDLGFGYGHDTDASSLSNGEAGSQHGLGKQGSPFLLHSSKPSTTPTLKFHNHFPPDTSGDKKDVLDGGMSTDGNVFSSPPLKRHKMMAGPPLNERVMLYVRQENEDVYTPLHVVPPTTPGLLNAIENKYKISTSSISNLFRKNKKGIIAKIDDDMLKYYCNEDLFLLEIKQIDGHECFEVTLEELSDH